MILKCCSMMHSRIGIYLLSLLRIDSLFANESGNHRRQGHGWREAHRRQGFVGCIGDGHGPNLLASVPHFQAKAVQKGWHVNTCKRKEWSLAEAARLMIAVVT